MGTLTAKIGGVNKRGWIIWLVGNWGVDERTYLSTGSMWDVTMYVYFYLWRTVLVYMEWYNELGATLEANLGYIVILMSPAVNDRAADSSQLLYTWRIHTYVLVCTGGWPHKLNTGYVNKYRCRCTINKNILRLIDLEYYSNAVTKLTTHLSTVATPSHPRYRWQYVPTFTDSREGVMHMYVYGVCICDRSGIGRSTPFSGIIHT